MSSPSEAAGRELRGLMPIEIDLLKCSISAAPPSDIFYWRKDQHQYRLRSKFHEVVADPYSPSFALRVQAVRDQIDDLISKYDISKSDIFPQDNAWRVEAEDHIVDLGLESSGRCSQR